MDSLIPASKMSNLTQGMFVGAVVDNEKVKRETARYVKLPQIIDFTDKDGNDRMQEEIQANYDRIRQDIYRHGRQRQGGRRCRCQETVRGHTEQGA